MTYCDSARDASRDALCCPRLQPKARDVTARKQRIRADSAHPARPFCPAGVSRAPGAARHLRPAGFL